MKNNHEIQEWDSGSCLQRRSEHHPFVRLLALAVAFCTVFSLIPPAAVMAAPEQTLNCPFVVHQHEAACYDGEGALICGKADFAVHTHGEGCYDGESNLVCALTEVEAHEHTDACFTSGQTLTCELAADENHTHGEGCYESVQTQVCTKEVIVLHTHSDACRDANGDLTCGMLEVTEHVHGDGCFTAAAEDTTPEETTTETTGESTTETTAETTVETTDETTTETTEATIPQENTTETTEATEPAIAPIAAEVVASGNCGSKATWVLTDDGVLTISGSGTMWGYSSSNTPWYSNRSLIKSVIVESGVTSISQNAFYNCDSLISITIPDGVTSIGSCAFYNCKKLTSITIPDSVTSIGGEAFRYCDSLTSVVIPDSVTSFGSHMFYSCDSLASVTIGNGVTNIGDYTFYYCSSLTDITIGGSVKSIGNDAFYGCSSLTSITIPDSVTSIYGYAFDQCTSLADITIPDSVTSIGRYVFRGCSSLTSITIPDSVTSIGESAFRDCDSLVSVIIPDGVSSIGKYAFACCDSLTSVTIKGNEAAISEYTFYDCNNLADISIEGSVASIVSNAFYSCDRLANVSITGNVTSIGDNAFDNCDSLNTVSITGSVGSIGNFAFNDCDGLTTVSITGSVNSIGNSAFYSCNALTSVTLPDGLTSIGSFVFASCYDLVSITIPGSVTSISNSAFWDCNDLTTVTIEDGVESIGDSAFYSCDNLTSVSIPNSVTSIGDKAFGSCSKLTEVTIPTSVTTIGNSAFSGCSGLTGITIPVGVTSIGESTFASCKNLTDITIHDGITSIGDKAFSSCSSLTSVTIPASVTSIGNDVFSNCTKLTAIEVDSNNPNYCSVDGVLYSKDMSTLICYPAAKTNSTKVVIPDGVTAIEDYAFYDCTDLTSITIPKSVTSIGNYAFYNCTNLTSITIPERVTSIGNYAFSRCTNLTDVRILGSVEVIGNSAFSSCTALTGITLPESVKTIGDSAFSSCSKLAEINIPKNVESIGSSAFYYCYGLTDITIPGSIKTIGSNTFYNCSGLTDITLEEGTETIGASAFSYCSGLKSIHIPGSVTSISQNAFDSSKKLTAIDVDESNSAYCSVDGILYSKDKTTLYRCPEGKTGLQGGTLPEEVTSIGERAFYQCNQLVSITLPDRITSIGAYAFYGCSGLKSINIPGDITYLNQSTFSGCSALSSITIPANVKTLAPRVFEGCRSLTRVTLESGDFSIRGSYYETAFYSGCTWLKEATVGSQVNTLTYTVLYNLGRSNGGLTDISFRGPNYFQYTGNDYTIGKLTMTAGAYYADEQGVLYRLNDDSTAVVVYCPEDLAQYEIVPAIPAEDGSMTYIVTAIGDSAFKDCAALTAIIIPDSVTAIGDQAFRNAGSLTQITLPAGLTSLGSYAFYDCTSLASVNGEASFSAVTEAWASAGANTATFRNTALTGQDSMVTTADIAMTDGTGRQIIIRTPVTQALTGQKVSTFLTIDEGDGDSDSYTRVYFQFANEHVELNFPVGPCDFDGVTGRVCKANAPNTYYVEIDPLLAGQVLNLTLTSTYKSGLSGGGPALIWVDVIGKDEYEALGNGVTKPEKAHKAVWTTQPDTFNVTTSAGPAPSLYGDGTEDGDVTIKHLFFNFVPTHSGKTATEGQDPIVSIDFVGALTLPEHYSWRDGLVEAICNGNWHVVTTSNDADFYVIVGSERYHLANLYNMYRYRWDYGWRNLPNIVDLSSLRLTADENGVIRIHWTCRGSSFLDYMEKNGQVEMSITFGDDVILADTEALSQDPGMKDGSITSTFSHSVDSTLNFTYSRSQQQTATASTNVMARTSCSVSMSCIEDIKMGEYRPSTINLTNSNAFDNADLKYILYPASDWFYITPADMEVMFRNNPYGEDLSITIANATLCSPVNQSFTGTDGQNHSISQQFMGTNTTHQGKAAAEGSGCVSSTRNTLTIGWSEDGTCLVLKTGAETIEIGEGELQSALDSLGFVVTKDTTYTCRWDLAGQTVYSGESRKYLARTTVKDSFMRVNQDTDEAVHPDNGEITGFSNSTRLYYKNTYTSGSYDVDVYRDFVLTQEARLNGTVVTPETLVKEGDILTWQTTATHAGTDSYEVLPMVGHLEGAQVLLVSVADNPALANEGLETMTVEGKAFYMLNKAGLYERVTIGGLLADRIEVQTTENDLDTTIYWYLTDIDGKTTVTAAYQALVSPEFSGVAVGGGYELLGEVWLNDHQAHRLYDHSVAYGTVLKTDTQVVTNIPQEELGNLSNHDPAGDELTDNYNVSAGEAVTYRLTMETLGPGPHVLTGDDIQSALPLNPNGYWSDENITVAYVAKDGTPVVSGGWHIETDPENPAQQYLRWDNDFSATIDDTLYVYVTMTYPVDEQWTEYGKAYGTQKLNNTFQVYYTQSSVTHLLSIPAEVLLQESVYQSGFCALDDYYDSLVEPSHADNRLYYHNDSQGYGLVTYTITLYNSGVTRFYLSDIQNVLPDGFTFFKVCSSTSYPWYASYDANNSNYYSGTMSVRDADQSKVSYQRTRIQATVSDDGNGKQVVTLSLSYTGAESNGLRYDEAVGRYYLDPGEALVVAYACKTNGYNESQDIANGITAMPYYNHNGAGVRIDVMTGVDRSYPGGKISNNGDRRLVVSSEAAGWGMDTTGYDESAQWLASEVSVSRSDIQPDIQVTAAEDYAHVTAPLVWSLKAINGGKGDLRGYTLTSVMTKPYQFTGAVGYRVGCDYGTLYGKTDSLFTIGTRTEGDTQVRIDYYRPSQGDKWINLTINGGYQYIEVSLPCRSSDSFNRTMTIGVSLSRDENGNEVLSVLFPEDTASAANIPAYGSATLTLQTKYFGNSYTNASFFNTAYVTPGTQPFDHDKVTQGNYIVYNGSDSVVSSDSVVVSYGYYTGAATGVTENGDTSNSAASDSTQNYIVLDNAASDFRYTLSVDNTSGSTGSQAMDMLVFINNLPQLGDHATFHPEILRFSEFQVNFCETPEFEVCVNNDELAEEAYTLQFSKTTEFSENDMNGTSTDGWYTLDQLEANGLPVTEMRSFRVVILDDSTGDEHIMPAEAQITVSFNARIDLSNGDLAPSSVAWNSFGYHYSLKGNPMELSASPQKVGVQTASVPCLVKELRDTDGNPFSAKEDTTFRFVIYEGEAMTLPGALTQEDVFTALADGTFTVVELTVKAGESISQRLGLSDLYCYRYENGSLVKTDTAWLWKNAAKYTIVELPLSSESIYGFGSFNETNPNNYTFGFNSSVAQLFTCSNVCNIWGIQLQKQCQLTAEPLAGAVFGLYSPAAVDRISDERFGTLTAQLENAPQKTVEVDGRTWYLMDIRTTDDEGLILWNDLSEKQYYLLELQAPTGYHPNKQPGQVIQAVDEIAMIIVTNAPCYELPDSGGMGTTVFYAAGAVMTGFSLLMGWNKKHKTRKTTAK